MPSEKGPSTDGVRASLIEAMSDPLRNQVFALVSERPGATLKEVAGRIPESPRRVRHQLERLIDLGLVEVEHQSTRRNTRESHYRVTAVPFIDDEPLSSEDERKLNLAFFKLLVSDISHTVSHGRLEGPGRHALYRLSGPVDAEGVKELKAIVDSALVEAEEALGRSTKRQAESGEAGTEMLAALLLFEKPPWVGSSERARSGWGEGERGSG